MVARKGFDCISAREAETTDLSRYTYICRELKGMIYAESNKIDDDLASFQRETLIKEAKRAFRKNISLKFNDKGDIVRPDVYTFDSADKKTIIVIIKYNE